MMKKDSVLNEVIKQLNLDLTPKEMRKKILKVEAVETTQLIQITVETTDPNLSADIANSIAAVSSNQIKEIQSQRFLQSKNTLEAQISDLENQIAIYEKLADNASTEDHKNRLDSKQINIAIFMQIYSYPMRISDFQKRNQFHHWFR
jgi:non-specific protein-tyrosine kinase